MNLRCLYCQTPFSLNRTEMLSALVWMSEKNHNHYDAHCPRCRRANSISRDRMQLFYPNWQQDAAKPKAEESAAPAQASAEVKEKKKPAAKKPAAAKPAAEKKPAAKKPAEKKTAEKKPAAKKTTTPKKK